MITTEQFCSFSLQGRLRLLGLYGKLVFEHLSKRYGICVFQVNGYRVVVIKDLAENAVLSAEPLQAGVDLYHYFKILGHGRYPL